MYDLRISYVLDTADLHVKSVLISRIGGFLVQQAAEIIENRILSNVCNSFSKPLFDNRTVHNFFPRYLKTNDTVFTTRF